MSKNEGIKLNTLFIDLNDRSSDNIISHSMAEIKNSGFTHINLELKTSIEQETTKLKIDIDLFGKIKEIQDLPDWVIVKLIMADGKLKGRSFKERVLNG